MKRLGRRLAVLAALLALPGSAWAAWKFGHPAGPPAAEYLASSSPAPGALGARFFGTTTLVFGDGAHAVMIDALLTRPGLRAVLFGRIASDPALVGRLLERSGTRSLDLLLISHSHYDHALDAGTIARRTGALIAGSASTREIALGSGVPEQGIRVIEAGDRIDAGDFNVTVYPALHSPYDRIPGTIDTPLRQPAKTAAFKEGGTYAFLIEHKGLHVLVQASANYLPGVYRGVKADAVFLAVGGLGAQPAAFARRYWHEVVEATGAKLVVPIHWDDFLRPVDQPQVPLRRFMDDFPAAMAKIAPLAERDGVAIRYMPVIAPVDLAAAVRAAAANQLGDRDAAQNRRRGAGSHGLG